LIIESLNRCDPKNFTLTHKVRIKAGPSGSHKEKLNKALAELGSGLLGFDSGTVAKYLGDTLHHFGCVVPHTDHGVCAHRGGMLKHTIEGVLPRFFAQSSEQRDVAAHQCLQACADGPEYRPGADNDAPHDAHVPDNPVTIERKGGRNHRVRNRWNCNVSF
jgi:hypothetical protein